MLPVLLFLNSFNENIKIKYFSCHAFTLRKIVKRFDNKFINIVYFEFNLLL